MGNGNGPPEAIPALPTRGRAAEPTGSLQRHQHVPQTLVLDPKTVPELRPCRSRARAQHVQHALLQAGSLAVHGKLGRSVPKFPNDLQVGCQGVARNQFQRHRRRRRRRAVLAGEDQVFPGSSEVKIRTTEGVDVTRATQSLARGGLLAAIAHATSAASIGKMDGGSGTYTDDPWTAEKGSILQL